MERIKQGKSKRRQKMWVIFIWWVFLWNFLLLLLLLVLHFHFNSILCVGIRFHSLGEWRRKLCLLSFNSNLLSCFYLKIVFFVCFSHVFAYIQMDSSTLTCILSQKNMKKPWKTETTCKFKWYLHFQRFSMI